MIKVYLFKEDPPFFNLNVGPVTIGLTKRNIIYLTIFGGAPALFFLMALLGAGNPIITGIIMIISIIAGYVFSIFRIENVPIDRFLYNKVVFIRKKDKINTSETSIDFSKGKRFEDVIKSKMEQLINKS